MVYDLFFIMFSILYLPYFLIRGKWRGFSRQRFGILPDEVLSELKGSRPVWIHAVSVGEVMASAPLYEEIRKNYPCEKIIVSTVTSTGNRVARDKFRDATIIYLPLDLSFITEKVIKIINPKVFLIAETEIWPNLISSLKSHGSKIALFNGRISKNSFKNYKLVRPLLGRLLDKVDLFLMQSQADADKIVSLGASKEKVRVTGNLKYDTVFIKGHVDEPYFSRLRRRFGLGGGTGLLIAGSTHPGEEEILLRCFKALSGDFPELRLLIAPRHIERAGQIAALSKRYGLKALLVSELKEESRPIKQDEILILDIMGTLSEVYSVGDVVFIGGTLIKKGGQNPLEAAYHSKPILFGPYTHNFEAITQELIASKAAVRVEDESGLLDSIRRLLKDSDGREAMGKRARAVLDSNFGVAKRDLEFIKVLIS